MELLVLDNEGKVVSGELGVISELIFKYLRNLNEDVLYFKLVLFNKY
jgi:hypothetical protein